MKVKPLLCAAALALALAATSAAGPARAAGLDLASQKGNSPIEIYADEGIEWSQDGQKFIARGNAKAIRGKVTVTADVLTAYYRDRAAPAGGDAAKGDQQGKDDPAKGGSSEIWRLDADGHVSIASDTQTATGDAATYDIDNAVLVMKGRPARLTTPTDTVTATESLEYWEKKGMAVARGNAFASREEKRIKADILTAYFKENTKKEQALDRAQAFGNVIVTTPQEVVLGDRGDYNAETGIVTLTGSVKLTRNENQLNGGYAVVNLNTGISKLFANVPGQAGGGQNRVQGLFVPERKEGGATAQPQPEQGR